MSSLEPQLNDLARKPRASSGRLTLGRSSLAPGLPVKLNGQHNKTDQAMQVIGNLDCLCTDQPQRCAGVDMILRPEQSLSLLNGHQSPKTTSDHVGFLALTLLYPANGNMLHMIFRRLWRFLKRISSKCYRYRRVKGVTISKARHPVFSHTSLTFKPMYSLMRDVESASVCFSQR